MKSVAHLLPLPNAAAPESIMPPTSRTWACFQTAQTPFLGLGIPKVYIHQTIISTLLLCESALTAIAIPETSMIY